MKPGITQRQGTRMRILLGCLFLVMVISGVCAVHGFEDVSDIRAEMPKIVCAKTIEAMPAASAEREESAAAAAVSTTGQQKYTDAKCTLWYNGKKLNTKDYPVLCREETYFIAPDAILQKRGPKLTYQYSKTTGRCLLIWQNIRISYHVGDKKLLVNGKKISLPQPVDRVRYAGSKNKTIVVPMEALFKQLGFTVRQEAGSWKLSPKAVTFQGETGHTSYFGTRASYTKQQYKAWNAFSVSQYQKALDATKDPSRGFQYLRLDRYREVDEQKFISLYHFLIQDYCKENKLNYKKSVLYDQAEVLLKTARKYNIDPVFFACQTFQESAYGTSDMATGRTIRKAAKTNFATKKNGKLQTRLLSKAVKVYNLYGIKAYDADPVVGGTSYAYQQGWTSVERAIDGAAQYLTENYITASYQQNTVFKMRYNPKKKNVWHQYATDVNYASEIGKRMYLFSSCYRGNETFLYDYPNWQD